MKRVPPLAEEDLADVLAGTEKLWPQLRGKRILLTGGTGFFGRWMIESFLAAEKQWGLGSELVVISREPERFLSGAPQLREERALRWKKAEVTKLTSEDFAGETFSAVIHLVTQGDMQATVAAPQVAREVIVGSTRRMLNVARATGAEKFLFTSSGAVYGAQPPELPCLPETYGARVAIGATSGTPYELGGAAKREAEILCEEAAVQAGPGAVIARCFSFSGPGLPLDGKFALGNFLQDALAGRPIVLTGDGTPVRTYLYASDLAVWLWHLLLRGQAGKAYNVGSAESVNLRELAELVSAEVGGGAVEVRGVRSAGVAAHRYVPDVRRAAEELGLRERVSLAEGVRKMAKWHRDAGRR